MSGADGGYVVPDAVIEALANAQRSESPWNALIRAGWEKRRAELAARPRHLKVRDALRVWVRTWQWRLSDAWAHLRGQPCSDSQA